MLTGIRLIIYDLDGVLVDTSDAICLSFNAALQDAGQPPCTDEEIRSMIGVPLDEMYRRVLPQERWGLIEGCFERYREVFMDISVEHTRMLEGVEETLSHFEEEGLQQCLATNKSTPEAEKILAHLGIDGYFDLIVGYDDVPNPKPSPDMILLALDAMGMEPGEAVLVEDSPTGLAAGKAAGVFTVGVATGFYSAKTLAGFAPDYLIDEIRALREIVFV
ncbi:MAG: HAD family hydrolase [Candidatus Bathyarchaeia archaeon]